MDEEPCGVTHDILPTDIIKFGHDESVMIYEGVTLVCSRPLNHTPPNLHSDGVTDWLGDE